MIRPYSDADTDAIIDVWYRASRDATPFLPESFLDEERHNIRELWLTTSETWVYEHDGMVAGFLSLIDDEVGAIFVTPASQGCGIGRALMDHAVSLRGGLFLDVFEDNRKGRGFYERYGFRFESKHVHEATGFVQHRLRYAPAPGRPRSG